MGLNACCGKWRRLRSRTLLDLCECFVCRKQSTSLPHIMTPPGLLSNDSLGFQTWTMENRDSSSVSGVCHSMFIAAGLRARQCLFAECSLHLFAKRVKELIPCLVGSGALAHILFAIKGLARHLFCKLKTCVWITMERSSQYAWGERFSFAINCYLSQ